MFELLLLGEKGVKTVALYKFLVGARLNHSSALEHDHPVAALRCGDPVSNEYDGTLGRLTLDGVENRSLGASIHG